jgi:hypothetical protein
MSHNPTGMKSTTKHMVPGDMPDRGYPLLRWLFDPTDWSKTLLSIVQKDLCIRAEALCHKRFFIQSFTESYTWHLLMIFPAQDLPPVTRTRCSAARSHQRDSDLPNVYVCRNIQTYQMTGELVLMYPIYFLANHYKCTSSSQILDCNI